MKRIWSPITAILVFLTAAVPILASTVTGALYEAQITATNVSYDAQRVSVPFTLSTQSLIAGNYVNSSLTNVAIQDASGNDIAFMPAQGAGDKWMMFIQQIGQTSALNYKLYTGGPAMNGKLRYFPGDAGMTVADSASLELGDTFEIQLDGYIDATNGVGKNLLFKDGAIRLYISALNTITLAIDDAGAVTSIFRPDGAGSVTDLPSYTGSANHWENVDDSVRDNATTTVWDATNGAETDLYQIPDLPVGSSGITSVVIHAWFSVNHSSMAAGHNPKIALKSGAYFNYTIGTGSGDYLNNLWAERTWTHTVDPNTGLAWTESAVNALEIGCNLQSAGIGAGYAEYCTQVYAEVTYLGDVTISSPITSAEHAIKVKSDGSTVNLYIDGVQSGSYTISGPVIDNSNDWIFGSNYSMPYIETVRVDVGGASAGEWEWENNTTFTDISGHGNDATPSFRTTTTDPDVSASIKDFNPASNAVFIPGDGSGTDIVGSGDIPPQPAGWYVDLHPETFPGGTAISDFFDGINIPSALFWLLLTYLGGAIIVMMTHKWSRKLLPAAMAGVIWNVFFAVSIGTGLWGLVPIGVISVGEMANRKKASL